MMAIFGAFVVWGAGWYLNIRLANGSHSNNPSIKALIPAIFGITLILVWELLVWAFDINPVILPAPSSISARLMVEGPRLWADFQQTIIKGAMTGYILGGLAAFGVAILADRSDFLTRGILPVGGTTYRWHSADLRKMARQRLGIQSSSCCSDGLLPDSREHGCGPKRHQCDATRPDADLRCWILAHAV